MEISGNHTIPAGRQLVWDLLNDPEVLKECIPGCEELNADSEDSFSAIVTLKIGPVKAKFSGEVELKDKNIPESYRIEAEGKGGIAGFANGGANVILSESESETILTYNVDANIGGKIAQLGSRLITSTTRKLADKFFVRFCEIASERSLKNV